MKMEDALCPKHPPQTKQTNGRKQLLASAPPPLLEAGGGESRLTAGVKERVNSIAINRLHHGRNEHDHIRLFFHLSPIADYLRHIRNPDGFDYYTNLYHYS